MPSNLLRCKIITLIKSKAKANKKVISKDEAEKILKEANKHNHDHDHNDVESSPAKKNKLKTPQKDKFKASKSKPKKS